MSQLRQTILIVDDEPPVLNLLGRILASADYQVLKATNGAEALAVSRSHTGPIDLVMTDVNMPETRGFVLGELLETLRPQTPVVYITGDPGVIYSWRERRVGQHWSLLLKAVHPRGCPGESASDSADRARRSARVTHQRRAGCSSAHGVPGVDAHGYRRERLCYA
jgi:CheY-like chemotaxis protein